MLKTNEYFDGKVKSIGFDTDTLPASVGVMESGEYVFNTDAKEKMTVVSGSMTIQLTDSEVITTYDAGESFVVPANSSFSVNVNTPTSYLCIYG